MATTTNFGWETPDDTDLVKDGAAAMRTLGGAIDTSLVDLKGGTTGQVLSKASNTDMDFSWIAVDPLTILDAKGDLISATAADTPARLAVGTNGQVLTADSTTSTGLKWATPAGGGKVLQVVQGTLTGNSSTTSTTFADTNLSVSITPSATSSKILIMYYHPYALFRSSATQTGGWITLLRGATDLSIPSSGENIVLYGASGSLELDGTFSVMYLDSPSTTSATTYKTQFRVSTGSTLYANVTGRTSSIIAMEIGA